MYSTVEYILFKWIDLNVHFWKLNKYCSNDKLKIKLKLNLSRTCYKLVYMIQACSILAWLSVYGLSACRQAHKLLTALYTVYTSTNTSLGQNEFYKHKSYTRLVSLWTGACTGGIPGQFLRANERQGIRFLFTRLNIPIPVKSFFDFLAIYKGSPCVSVKIDQKPTLRYKKMNTTSFVSSRSYV